MSLISFIKEAGQKLFGHKEAAAAAPVDVDAANKTASDAIAAYINTQGLKVDGSTSPSTAPRAPSRLPVKPPTRPRAKRSCCAAATSPA